VRQLDSYPHHYCYACNSKLVMLLEFGSHAWILPQTKGRKKHMAKDFNVFEKHLIVNGYKSLN
jgi:hypothetical protein